MAVVFDFSPSDAGDAIGPGYYVDEPVEHRHLAVVGDDECIVSITVAGNMEYLAADGTVSKIDNTATVRAAYYRWCEEHGRAPDARVDIGRS